MKRKLGITAAMLLLTACLTAGTLGTASQPAWAQDAVHEADGTWYTEGSVSFKITWKGVTYIRWKQWIDGPVNSWEVTATDSQSNTKTKVPKNAQREVRYGNLTFGEDYTVVVKALDGVGDELGRQQVTIRPRHVSPPEPVTDLNLSVGDDNLSVDAHWTAPEAGGKPKRYSVWLTNLDTGRARGKVIKVKQGKGGEITLKTNTAFGKLWPGDTYRVSVRTRNQNSRSTWGAGNPQSWQNSAWTHTTIAIPAGSDPAYTKVAPTLIWEPVLAGEKAPPYVIGKPTAYIVMDTEYSREHGRDVPVGRPVWFDAPNECKDHTNHDHEAFFKNNDEDAMKARRKAQGQEGILDQERAELAQAVAAKQQYLDGTPEAERDRGKIARLDQAIARHQRNIEAGEKVLAGLVAELATECARAYPVVESLTDDDNRWYRTAQTKEVEPTER